MAMAILEHEDSAIAVAALGSRLTKTLFNFAADDIPQNFLIKKMEINFTWDGTSVSADTSQHGMLVFRNSDTSVADSLDARLDDDKLHQKIIWAKAVNINLFGTSTTTEANVAFMTLNTSKSFPKGFPMSREDGYQWSFFNVAAGAMITGSIINLRVRYFGVYL